MKKMKFFGLLFAFSFLLASFAQAQVTVTRIAGGSTGSSSVSVCNHSICLTPVPYPGPGSHTFSVAPADLFSFVIFYASGNFDVLSSTVDSYSGFLPVSNGTNTLLIRKVSTGVYEFFII